MKEEEQKRKLIDKQEVLTIIFIIALIISFFLLDDKRRELSHKKRLFNNKKAQDIALFQSILVLAISIFFSFIRKNFYDISKFYNDNDTSDLFLQLKVSVLPIITAIVGLYIIIKNYNNNLNAAEIENI